MRHRRKVVLILVPIKKAQNSLYICAVCLTCFFFTKHSVYSEESKRNQYGQKEDSDVLGKLWCVCKALLPVHWFIILEFVTTGK